MLLGKTVLIVLIDPKEKRKKGQIKNEEEINKMHQRTLKTLLFSCVFVFVLSCETQTVYSDYSQLDNGVWKANDTIKFNFSEVEALEKYHMFMLNGLEL